jgi:hypothetical protein
MPAHKVARVCLVVVDGPSRIETCYGNEKLIRIYLTIRPSADQVQNFKPSVLQDFISVVQGYAVVNFEASNQISPETVRLFCSVCQQNNRIDRHMAATNDDHRLVPPSPQAEPIAAPANMSDRAQILAEDEEVKSMQDILQRIAQVSSNPNQITRGTISAIINDMSRVISAPRFNLPGTINNYQQQPRHPIMTQRSLSNPQPQPVQPQPVQPQPVQPQPVQPVNQLATLLQQLSAQNPVTSIQQMTQNIPAGSGSSVDVVSDSEPPTRFMVNERNPREVLIHQNPQTDITLDVSSSDVNTNVRLVPSRTASIGNMRRCGVSDESIITAARCVHNSISTTVIRPPDFTNTTRSGYRKIKNFVHNLTKIWLSQSEIDKFLIEINKIDTMVASDDEFEASHT